MVVHFVTQTIADVLPEKEQQRKRPIPDEQRLLATVLHDYDTASRPVFNASDRITVKFGLTLTQIADMVCSHEACPVYISHFHLHYIWHWVTQKGCNYKRNYVTTVLPGVEFWLAKLHKSSK